MTADRRQGRRGGEGRRRLAKGHDRETEEEVRSRRTSGRRPDSLSLEEDFFAVRSIIRM